MKHSCPKCNEVYETKDLLNYVHKQLHEQILAEKDAEIARLRRALEFIASSIPTGNGYSHAHLAKKTLEARG